MPEGSNCWCRSSIVSGTLPVPAYRLGRLIMVGEPLTGTTADTGQTVVYARVSSAGQKADLDRQVARVTMWATGQRLAVDRVVTEVGSALLCARLYGRRAAVDRARRAVEAATEDPA